MIVIYGETGRNSLAAKNLYAVRIPNRHHPPTATIVGAVYRPQNTRPVTPRYEGRTLKTSRIVLQ